ncbi:acyl-CoA dehydrogenase family protein [Bradyrhizobium yuanmingense]|uniref:acyl-CoA dehydrogenase family protein n=1 Tax=Bradyrhizobium yuanmingense TaxID=108015 RepID=UPI001FD1C56D|nr:acyl-CoA dehydrogenase family protein [Bradyrhizobium yuanmingense]
MSRVGAERTREIADRVQRFVRDVVVPFERDPWCDHHDYPEDELVTELRELARATGVLTPHILAYGSHLSQDEAAIVLAKAGLSPFNSLACDTAAPDEGNIYPLWKIGSPEIKERFP